MMQTVNVNASRAYTVHVGAGLLDKSGGYILAATGSRRALIVSDSNVYPLYGERVKGSLASAGISAEHFVFPAGEASKGMKTYAALSERLCALGYDRGDVTVALGGGVTGDLAGFAAATFTRGMKLAALPTSLLAQVDSSVGGKTAINLEGGKNMLGCFYQPHVVLCDTGALGTLPYSEYTNGCAEIIKYAMIGSETLFEQLLKVPVNRSFESVIADCVRMKRGFVERDERDNGPRMLLNFGHTYGHAAEKLSGYTLPHGRAVAMGMAYITRAAVRQGICREEALNRLIDTLNAYDLPSEMPYSDEELVRAAASDKKSAGDSIRLIVPLRAGECRVLTLPKDRQLDWLTGGYSA